MTARPAQRPRVQAAGAVVWRRAPHGIEVALVHRPKYDDWTFPKGKLDAGETFEAAAVREVAEETGLLGSLGAELASTRYRDAKGRPKVVRYWAMEIAEPVAFAPNDEVDELHWLPVGEVADRLSYDHDVDVLASFVEAVASAS